MVAYQSNFSHPTAIPSSMHGKQNCSVSCSTPYATWGLDLAGNTFGDRPFHGEVVMHKIGVPAHSRQNPDRNTMTQYMQSHFRVASVTEHRGRLTFHCRPDEQVVVNDHDELATYASVVFPRMEDVLRQGGIEEFSVLFHMEFVEDEDSPMSDTNSNQGATESANPAVRNADVQLHQDDEQE